MSVNQFKKKNFHRKTNSIPGSILPQTKNTPNTNTAIPNQDRLKEYIIKLEKTSARSTSTTFIPRGSLKAVSYKNRIEELMDKIWKKGGRASLLL